MARLNWPILALVPLLASGISLSACGVGGAVTDARRSCVNVRLALSLEKRSESPGISATRRAALQADALSELLKATPMAAEATSIDGSWNPLMTTIGEAERVPIVDLVPSLTRLCQVANSTSPYL